MFFFVEEKEIKINEIIASKDPPLEMQYNARRLIGSRIIESAKYCNQIMLVPLYLNS